MRIKKIKPKGAKYCYPTKWNIHSRTWLFTFYNSKMKVVAKKRMKLHANISKSIIDLSPLDYHLLKRKFKNR